MPLRPSIATMPDRSAYCVPSVKRMGRYGTLGDRYALVRSMVRTEIGLLENGGFCGLFTEMGNAAPSPRPQPSKTPTYGAHEYHKSPALTIP